MVAALLVLYFGLLGLLSLVGVQRLGLGLSVLRPPKDKLPSEDHAGDLNVLIQLPLYNEPAVAKRVIEAAAAIRYPSERLTIQVLDDSDDETRAIVDRTVERLARSGTSISVHRRGEREGYKAGALAAGLSACEKADLVAIFDADFIPQPDFLEKSVPWFKHPKVGLVQARWTHLNRRHSVLTRAQGIFLDGHFAVEHEARWRLCRPFNFNGTAGIWRREAIEEGGGWQGDTVTEDLDLSYRSQLKGWRFVYRHEVTVPAELPEDWLAFRDQQARWVKGSAQSGRKLSGLILRSKWSTLTKLHALFHLWNNAAYVAIALLGLLLPIALVTREELGWRVPGGRVLLGALDYGALGLGTISMVLFYLIGNRRTGGRWYEIPLALAVGAGMSVANALAFFHGLFTSKTEFVRTPKVGAQKVARVSVFPRRAKRTLAIILLELVITSLHIYGIIYAFRWGVFGAIPFLGMYAGGLALVSCASLVAIGRLAFSKLVQAHHFRYPARR